MLPRSGCHAISAWYKFVQIFYLYPLIRLIVTYSIHSNFFNLDDSFSTENTFWIVDLICVSDITLTASQFSPILQIIHSQAWLIIRPVDFGLHRKNIIIIVVQHTCGMPLAPFITWSLIFFLHEYLLVISITGRIISICLCHYIDDLQNLQILNGCGCVDSEKDS